jgi:sugar transferase (PEP-CTERM/EpsH1 system associated)
MKLLMLCHRMPYPPHKGEKIRAWNILKFLAERHDVSLVCLADDVADLEHIEQLRPYAGEILVERIRPRLDLALALPSILGMQPITIPYFYSRALQRRMDALIERKEIHGLLCSSSPMAAYVFRSRQLERIAQMRRVMDLIDVDSHKWRQYAAASSFCTAWVYRHEMHHLAAFERRIAREFHRVLLSSERERRYFPDASAIDRLSAMPNGVDLEFFSPNQVAEAPARAEPILVFTGVMSYRPNVDGILWFVDRILPRVRAVVPRVQLHVVGSQPDRKIVRLERTRGITVTGYVDDVRPYLKAASVCIVPLRIARGLQNKVLEAMAMGRAVVTTREAFEGIEATPGRDLLVANDEAGFADAVIELLQNAGRRSEVGRCARARVEREYAWSENLRLLDELFPPTAVDTGMRLEANQQIAGDGGVALGPVLLPPA